MSTPPTRIHAVGKLSRLKLSEPVRLYLYGLGGLALAALFLAGAITEEWQTFGLTALGVVLGLVPATEAARASVYSTAGMVRQLQAAARANSWKDAA